ncbi:MAG: Ig-like domain-containing protein, partial [Bacteroidales bacterium]|nr:Ig-like domain-containing protein [Bacteroidales bacterium]
MKRVVTLIVLLHLALVQYAQIIADHTVVDRYDDIPSNWIDSVKKMHIAILGTSHGRAYDAGLALLEAIDPKYAVNVSWLEAETSSYLRFSTTWNALSGWGTQGPEEEHWHTWKAWPEGTEPGEKDTVPNIITRSHTLNRPIDVIGFGWCVDMMSSYTSLTRDPVYKVKWMGPSVGGPDGSKAWGLDADDYSITRNRVSLDTYLEATKWFQDYCDARGYDTKVIFTTGVADSVIYYGEPSYQRYIKNEYMRAYVKADPSRVLLDYEDIVCYDDGSTTPHTAVWSYDGVDYVYPLITPRNSIPFEGYHISRAGALRLGKAIWWMMARIAGWDGGTSSIAVTSITVTGAGGSTLITQDNGTLQLVATVLPTTATDRTVTWSIVNGTGQATISATGLVTALSNGTVTARASANDGSGVVGSLVITISNQDIAVTSITVTGAGGSTLITQDNGTLQLVGTVLPTTADRTVTWSIVNGTGQATISATGLVTAVSNGTVTARASANDESGVVG